MMRGRIVLAGIFVGLFVLSALSPVMASQLFEGPTGLLTVGAQAQPAARTFTIIVSSTGLNGSSDPLTLQVNQGDNVTIMFVYGDGALSFDNPHVISVESYHIQTRTLDRSAPLQRISFIAGQAGVFKIHCIIPCFGMENLQNGALEVAPSSTKISVGTALAIHHMEYHPNLHVHIIAFLVDSNNKPVPGVLVDFYVDTSFGFMKIGSNVTQSDGSASLLYPLFAVRDLKTLVSFGGNGNFRPSNWTGILSVNRTSVQENATVPYLSGQTKYIDLRLVGVPALQTEATVMVILVVVGAVWSVYVFVLTQVSAIRRSAKEEEKR